MTGNWGASVLIALLIAAPAALRAQDSGSGLSTILQTAEAAPYGTYMVTAEGRPLYAFSADTPRAPGAEADSRCIDACARQWPPLGADTGAVASPEIDHALIAKTQRQDGASQLLFGGYPVYLFADDRPGEPPTGHGRKAYGGVWLLIGPEGKPIPLDG